MTRNPAYDPTRSNSVCPRCRRTECRLHRKLTPTPEMYEDCRRAMLDACISCKVPGFERDRRTVVWVDGACPDCMDSKQHFSAHQTHKDHTCVTCDGTGDAVQ